MYDFKKEVLEAEARIRPFVRETPLDYAIALSHQTGCDVYLKCENFQYTGAFKIRGALNKLLTLTAEQRSQGVVTASSGNHGAAVAYGLNKLHIPGIVFVPENASSIKVENIRNFGTPIEFYAQDCMHTELFAMDYAKRHKMVYVSPYNDLHVIAGQGTIANELTYQHNQLDAIFVPVGGGGLISGIAGFIKTIAPQINIIGCQPEHSPVMLKSIEAGRIIQMDIKPTLSDATTGGIEPGAITFDFCKNYVDEFVIVSEQDIADAIIYTLQTQHMIIEGAAALTMAAFLKIANRFRHKNVALILSGANISIETLKSVFSLNPLKISKEDTYKDDIFINQF